jgi:hypothetical protein
VHHQNPVSPESLFPASRARRSYKTLLSASLLQQVVNLMRKGHYEIELDYHIDLLRVTALRSVADVLGPPATEEQEAPNTLRSSVGFSHNTPVVLRCI